MNIPDIIDINRLGENIVLDSAEDQVECESKHTEPDFSKMFQTCSSVSEIKDGNVLFTNGTAISLSEILQTNPSLVTTSVLNDQFNIGVPVHDLSFDKPSYVETDERMDTYKKIFLAVLPKILRRESYPFNFDRIIDLSNEITVKTMRQFTKMKEYYLQQI